MKAKKILYPHSMHIITTLFIFTMMILCSYQTNAATRDTDIGTPSKDNTIISVPGSFAKTDVTAVLKIINDYRSEACKNGYPDPRDPSKKLSMADYKPIKWSGDLEWIAQTRAAEGTIRQDHVRTNGTICFTCTHNGVNTYGECLAWNGSLTDGIKSWYQEKQDWIKQTGATTGHYTQMIDPDNCAVGIGCFSLKTNPFCCIAGEFSSESALSESSQGVDGAYSQKIEVPTNSLSPAVIEGKSSLPVDNQAAYIVIQNISFPNYWGNTSTTPIELTVQSWTSSNQSVATISCDGKLTALSEGTATISASLENGTNISKAVTVTSPAKGTKFKSGNVTYKITKLASEVEYVAKAKAKGSVLIPGSINYKGRSYKVTSIAASAFKGNKKIKTVKIAGTVAKIGKSAFQGCSRIKSVTLPAGIRSIGKQAFYKCTALKSLTLKTKKLKKSSVGSNSFGKTKIKIVKCPKGKNKAYKKFLVKKGINKKAVFK